MNGWTTQTIMVQRDGRVFHRIRDYRNEVIGHALLGRVHHDNHDEWNIVCDFCEAEVGPARIRRDAIAMLVDHLNDLDVKQEPAGAEPDQKEN